MRSLPQCPCRIQLCPAQMPVLFSSAAVLSAVRCILTCICSIFSTICRSVCGFILSLTLGFILRLVPCFSGTRLVRIIIVSRIILCHASLLLSGIYSCFVIYTAIICIFQGLLCIIFIKFQPSMNLMHPGPDNALQLLQCVSSENKINTASTIPRMISVPYQLFSFTLPSRISQPSFSLNSA